MTENIRSGPHTLQHPPHSSVRASGTCTYRCGGMDNYIYAYAMHSAYTSKERKALAPFSEGALTILCVMDWGGH